MKTFRGLTADEFYFRRDKRTTLSVAEHVLSNAKLTLSIDQAEAASFEGQLAFLTLVNISARWCRVIAIDAPAVELHADLKHLYAGALSEAALRVAEAADPFGSFSQAKQDISVRIHVGKSGHPSAFSICGRGWLSYTGSAVHAAPVAPVSSNPLGALLAACIGASHALRSVIGDVDLCNESVLSLWNLEAGPNALDGPALSRFNLGKVLMVGLGAVGSSIAYALSFLPISVDLTDLVDADSVDYLNLNRGPIFFADDVDAKKVLVVDKLAPLAVRNAIPSTVEDAVTHGLRIFEYDLVIPAANVPLARETIMLNTPPLMISASTGTQWDAYRQRHVPLLDDCLVCRFPSNRPLAKLGCAEGDITPEAEIHNAEPETGALPFLSLLGAVMAVADIAKIPFPDAFISGSNRAILPLRTQDPTFFLSQKAPRLGCSYCTQEALFRAFGTGRAFAGYSLNRIAA